MIVNHSTDTTKSSSLLHRRALWLCLVLVLAGSLNLPTFTLGRDDAKPPKKEQKPASLGAAQMIIRGPERAVVGQRFSAEVFILNTGSTPLRDLEFLAKPDVNLAPEGKPAEQRIAVPSI